jgi:hypothetical protein
MAITSLLLNFIAFASNSHNDTHTLDQLLHTLQPVLTIYYQFDYIELMQSHTNLVK